MGVKILPGITDLSLAPEHMLSIIRCSHTQIVIYMSKKCNLVWSSLLEIQRLHSIVLVNDEDYMTSFKDETDINTCI